jgi:hypothetical protein
VQENQEKLKLYGLSEVLVCADGDNTINGNAEIYLLPSKVEVNINKTKWMKLIQNKAIISFCVIFLL